MITIVFLFLIYQKKEYHDENIKYLKIMLSNKLFYILWNSLLHRVDRKMYTFSTDCYESENLYSATNEDIKRIAEYSANIIVTNMCKNLSSIVKNY